MKKNQNKHTAYYKIAECWDGQIDQHIAFNAHIIALATNWWQENNNLLQYSAFTSALFHILCRILCASEVILCIIKVRHQLIEPREAES